MRQALAVFVWLFVFGASVEAQELVPVVARNDNGAGAKAPVPEDEKATEDKEEEEAQLGFKLPNTEKFRVWVSFMGGYGFDPAQATLGFEKQGRPGYAIIGIGGKLSPNLSYKLVINPITENQPRASCGEKDFFYPNTASAIGPNVACDNQGRQRVDDYRFVALDPLMQAGPIREAYVEYAPGGLSIKAGQFVLPIGFNWEEMGSFTAKDATHIQRINTEASFGFQLGYTKKYRGRNLWDVSFAGFIGDGNKFKDYTYFYFIDGSLDSNSWPTMLLSGGVSPIKGLDFRVALKRGHTGSKVERLPNLFASKRYDYANVFSAQYEPIKGIRVFGESARYTWGLVESSAALLEMPHLGPIDKNGYYYGIELSRKLSNNFTVGTILTREELDRDDTLIQHLAHLDLYGVEMGKKERNTAMRFYVDVKGGLRIGVFHNNHNNPFPWVSGIAPVSGERAFQVRPGSKWGLVMRVAIQ